MLPRPGIRRFTRRKQDACFQEQIGCRNRGGHIGALSHRFHAVGDKRTCGIDIQFVLGGTRQSDIDRH
jgi:hypothetical protein